MVYGGVWLFVFVVDGGKDIYIIGVLLDIEYV